MRLSRLLASVCVAALATSALAADRVATLRAGDGASDSWIEIDVGDARFLVEQTGARKVDFVMPGADWDFDVSAVAASRGASRLASAREVRDPIGTRLRFLMNCDCDFAAIMGGGVVTIEFRDRSPSETEDVDLNNQDDPLTELSSVTQALAAPNQGAPTGRSTTSRFAPLRAPLPRGRDDGDEGASTDDLSASNDDGAQQKQAEASPPSSAADDDRAEEVRLARQRLLEQLSRAAEQGLLDFASKEAEALAPEPPADPVKPEPAQEPEPEPEPEVERTPAAPEQPQTPVETAAAPRPADPVEVPVRARTAIDKAFRADRRDTIIVPERCVEDWRLDMTYWPGEAGFAEDRAAYTRSLLDEFDKPDASVATGLARLYVAWGFGAEARQTIDLYGEVIDDAALLRDLALIVDGLPPTNDGPIAAAGPCSGPVALWFKAAGLQGDPNLAPPGVDDALLEALEKSPGSIRALLGPKLLNDRLDARDLAMASRIDRSLSRMQHDFGPALDLARARLLAASGDVASAEALFGNLASTTLPESQDALLLLFESLVNRGAQIRPSLTNALGEAAFLARGGARERELKVAEIRATALSEGLPAALLKIRNAVERRPIARPILEDAGHAALEQAAAKDDPFAYAQAVIEYAPFISTDQAGDAARLRISQELRNVGLPNAALKMLDPALARATPPLRLAAAAAHLALDEAEAALDALEGLGGEKAASLRADALAALGRLPDAAVAAAEASSDDRSDRAFLLRDWEQAARSGEDSNRLLAAFMAQEADATAAAETASATAEEGVVDDIDPSAAAAFVAPPNVGASVTLRDARSVMDASETVRSVIEEALNDG